MIMNGGWIDGWMDGWMVYRLLELFVAIPTDSDEKGSYVLIKFLQVVRLKKK